MGGGEGGVFLKCNFVGSIVCGIKGQQKQDMYSKRT